mmetsp:Transcript_9319/g.16480  ORF Transcript_9319/g.16480 Transcript_9319/m.16480 type:complete len:223 (-) Transcript_9319:4090-4758(-)
MRLACGGDDPLDGHNLRVHIVAQVALLVQEVAESPRHPCGHVAAHRAQAHHCAPCHVLAAVIARALHHGVRHAVAHSKALARTPVDVQGAAGSTIEAGVADQARALRGEGGAWWGHDGHFTATHALAHVIVCLANQEHVHALDVETRKGLAAAACELDMQISCKALVTMLACNGSCHPAQTRPIHVGDVVLAADGTLRADGLCHLRVFQDAVVQLRAVAVHG